MTMLLRPFLLLTILWSVLSFAGTSVGNFRHQDELTFDFHIAHFRSWKFEPLAQEEVFKVWRIGNLSIVEDPAKESWIELTFLLGFEAETQAELLVQIQKLHPTLRWTPVNKEGIVGYVSDEITNGPESSMGHEYYLTKRRHVVHLQRRSHKAGNGASQLQVILSTINRVSNPPRIKKILTVPDAQTPVQVGDTVCYHVYMDDLKDSYSGENLTQARPESAHKHWHRHLPTWNQKEFRFETCVKVSSRYSSSGLKLSELTLGNSRGQNLYCKPKEGDTSQLSCHFFGKLINGRVETKIQDISYSVPHVENPKPDLKGPEAKSFIIHNGILKIEFNDHDFSMGEVHIKDNSKLPIFADQMKEGRIELGLKRYMSPGWNLISTIALYDHVGNYTIYRVPEETEDHTVYEKVTEQEVSPSSHPILSDLNITGGQK